MAASSAERVKPGISTAVYWELAPEDVIAHLAGLCIRHVDLCAEHLTELASGGRGRIERFRGLAADLGVTLWQTHSVLDLDLAQDDDRGRAEHLRFLSAQIRHSAALGAPNIVVHPGTGGRPESSRHHARALQRNVESFRKAADVAGESGIRLAIENLGLDAFGGRIEDLYEIIQAVGSPLLGICLDTGHANLRGLDVPGAVRQCGSLLACTHLNDNDGNSDLHRLPGFGKLDWFAIVEALRDIQYTGPLCFEIFGENKCPLALRDLKVHVLMQTAEFLSDPARAHHGLAVRSESARSS